MKSDGPLKGDDVSVVLFDPELYAQIAGDGARCRVCGHTAVVHPIANIFTNRISKEESLQIVCDYCAHSIVPHEEFSLLLRVRQVLSRSEFAIDTVAAVYWNELTNEPNHAENYCSHCGLEFVVGVPGTTKWIEYFLCEKDTRAPICDICAELLATQELRDLLSSSRRER